MDTARNKRANGKFASVNFSVNSANFSTPCSPANYGWSSFRSMRPSPTIVQTDSPSNCSPTAASRHRTKWSGRDPPGRSPCWRRAARDFAGEVRETAERRYCSRYSTRCRCRPVSRHRGPTRAPATQHLRKPPAANNRSLESDATARADYALTTTTDDV